MLALILCNNNIVKLSAKSEKFSHFYQQWDVNSPLKHFKTLGPIWSNPRGLRGSCPICLILTQEVQKRVNAEKWAKWYDFFVLCKLSKGHLINFVISGNVKYFEKFSQNVLVWVTKRLPVSQPKHILISKREMFFLICCFQQYVLLAFVLFSFMVSVCFTSLLIKGWVDRLSFRAFDILNRGCGHVIFTFNFVQSSLLTTDSFNFSTIGLLHYDLPWNFVYNWRYFTAIK